MDAPGKSVSSKALLDAAIAELGFSGGELLPASDDPTTVSSEVWLEKGDWLALGKTVGAESVFFVDQNPVIVFARLDESSPESLERFYNRVWCMARPQLLFLARPGELAVYDLTKPPMRPGEEIAARGRLFSARVQTVAAVQQKLAQFRREEVETGRIFGDARFGFGDRADRALVRDLQIVRRKLLEGGLEAKYAHALIGRSIFIRYLEDRKILVPEYFKNLAATNEKWEAVLLGQQDELFPADPDFAHLCYPRVLSNKEFTYALFKQLATDFNGDMFPVEDEERNSVTVEHLIFLRRLLLGEATEQLRLFFFAYSFDVIPIELISSIYEEFYNTQRGKSKNHGSHYTPSALVDFVLSRTLTSEVLDRSPRVIDPACGSGIFIVESFRRMVRHLAHKQQGRRPSRRQLRRILRDHIAGIDINEEAVRVAAFSLYLAFLHYQEPREINEERKLPRLKWSGEKTSEEDFNILWNGNAFSVFDFKMNPEVAKRFGRQTAQVLVGNPPWGNQKDDVAVEWCNAHAKVIGDKELSQAFVHLALELLPEGGRSGMLLSSGVLFKQHAKSRLFRKQWLSSSKLEHVVNFAQVRHVFFRGSTRKSDSIAPFVSAVFEKGAAAPSIRFAYWSAKRTALVEKAQAVVLSKADMHWLFQRECLSRDDLWKIYWWGGHRDEALVRSLERFPRLANLHSTIDGARLASDFGFIEGIKGRKPSGWLQDYKEFPVGAFTRYGPLPTMRLAVPAHVRRQGTPEAYEGHRLLIRRGVPTEGKLTVRLETKKFCFRHSIFALRLEGFKSWQEKALLGVLWSSLARYYLFLTAGSWGMWHDEINWENLGNLPIALPETSEQRSKLLALVDQLQTLNIHEALQADDDNTVEELEQQLDEIIFDIYELNQAERDLVKDMCMIGLDFLYNGQLSHAAHPISVPIKTRGTESDVSRARTGFGAYLRTFLGIWRRDLEVNSKLTWEILHPGADSQIVALYITDNERSSPVSARGGISSPDILNLLNENARHMEGSRRIFIDTFIRTIANNEIMLVKRNELRFWTQTAAREDAEATQLQAIQLQELQA